MKRRKGLARLQDVSLLLLFFFLCFTDSVTPTNNKLECSNGFLVLIISSISSFEINNFNPFPALTAPFPIIFLSIFLIAFEVKLLTNQGKLFLANGIVSFLSAFFPKVANQEPKDPPDWIVRYLNVTKFYICWRTVSKGIFHFSCLSYC